MNTLVIDHQTNTYTITNGTGQHSAPIRHKGSIKHVAGYFEHIGYSVQIIHRKGLTPPMALSPSQQAIVDRNHWRALYAVKHGSKKVNGQTLKAMVNRNFITFNLEILPAGDEFYAGYQPDPEDLELDEVQPTESTTPRTLETTPAATAITPAAAAPVTTNPQPVVIAASLQPAATDETRDMIIELRRVALQLGRALAVERVPELRELFEAIERSDNYLFRR